MAVRYRGLGHTPKWLRHHQKAASKVDRQGITTTNERTRNIDIRVRRLAEVVSEVHQDLADAKREGSNDRNQLRSRLSGVVTNVVQETQATVELLFQVTSTRAPMPYTGGWAMDASSMLAVLHEVRRSRPSLVIECGSGSSTVWIGYVLEELGCGRIISLEHDPEYAKHTRAELSQHELDAWATVIDAPLVTQTEIPEEPLWYDLSNLPEGLPSIDLLLVDGPPAQVGTQARYPAIPVMASRLAVSATIVLDDTGRPDEQAILERWVQEFSALTLGPLQPARATFAMWALG